MQVSEQFKKPAETTKLSRRLKRSITYQQHLKNNAIQNGPLTHMRGSHRDKWRQLYAHTHTLVIMQRTIYTYQPCYQFGMLVHWLSSSTAMQLVYPNQTHGRHIMLQQSTLVALGEQVFSVNTCTPIVFGINCTLVDIGNSYRTLHKITDFWKVWTVILG